jgi:hypothetical protein
LDAESQTSSVPSRCSVEKSSGTHTGKTLWSTAEDSISSAIQRNAALADLCKFVQRPIAQLRRLHAGDRIGIELGNTVFALDSTTIDLCFSEHLITISDYLI